VLSDTSSRKIKPADQEDSTDVQIFVTALKDLAGAYPGFYRVFLAKYLDSFDGVVDHNPRTAKQKADRLGVSASTFKRYVQHSRFRLKAKLEEIINP